MKLGCGRQAGLPNGGAGGARAGGEGAAAQEPDAQAWPQPTRSLRTARRRSLHFYEDAEEDDEDYEEPPPKVRRGRALCICLS